MGWFKKKNKVSEDDDASVWKSDFSDCITADYLPEYSVCQCPQNSNCRFVTRYAGMLLCSNPDHKSFIPEGAETFDPHKRRNLD